MRQAPSCLACQDPLEDGDRHYHPACCSRLFDRARAPELSYTNTAIKDLAKQIVKRRSTIPGVQAKLSLQLETTVKGSSRLTLVGLWGNYILKPPVEKYPLMPEIENLTMQLAASFRIATVPHGLIPLKSGELAYISRRIDRVSGNQKLHMEDMCQLSGRLTEDKYRGSMEQIGKIIRRHASNPLLDCIRFFEVALFSFLTGNADMHLKNFSLIYPVNEMIQLSPAYDLLSTRLLIPESDDPEEMALMLNGKKRNFTAGDFSKFSANLGLNRKQVQNIFERFKKALPGMAVEIEKGFLPTEIKEQYKSLISQRASRLGLV